MEAQLTRKINEGHKTGFVNMNHPAYFCAFLSLSSEEKTALLEEGAGKMSFRVRMKGDGGA